VRLEAGPQVRHGHDERRRVEDLREFGYELAAVGDVEELGHGDLLDVVIP
jgi:hypothetical protein